MCLGLLGGRAWLPWTVTQAHERRRRPQGVPQVPSTSQLPLTSSLSPSSGHTHGPERSLCPPLSGRAPCPRSAWAHRLGPVHPTPPARPRRPSPLPSPRPGPAGGSCGLVFQPARSQGACGLSAAPKRQDVSESCPLGPAASPRLLSPPRPPGFSPCGCTRRHRQVHVDRLPPRQVLA